MSPLLTALAYSLCEMPAVAMRISPFRRSLEKRKKLLLTALYLLIMGVNLFVTWYAAKDGKADDNFHKLDMIVVFIAVTAVNFLVIPRYWAEIIFVSGVEVAMSTILPVSIGYVSSLFFDQSMQHVVTGNVLVEAVIYLLAFPAFNRLLSDCITPFLELKTDTYWHTVCWIPTLLFLANASLYSYGYRGGLQDLLGQLLIFAAVLLFCISVAKDASRIRSKEMLTVNMQMQKQYYHSLTEKVELARRHLHDAKYITVSIQRFIEADDKEGLAEFCKTLIPKRYYQVDMFHSGNAAVDGVLYHYVQRAEAENVKFKIVGTVKNPGIPDDEMCILLGNALENAFTACQTLPDNRFVSFTAQTEANVLSLMVRNSFDGLVTTKHGIIQSRKRSRGPGIGIASMKEICERHGGMMQTQWSDGVFTVLMILTLKNSPDASETE